MRYLCCCSTVHTIVECSQIEFSIRPYREVVAKVVVDERADHARLFSFRKNTHDRSIEILSAILNHTAKASG